MPQLKLIGGPNPFAVSSVRVDRSLNRTDRWVVAVADGGPAMWPALVRLRTTEFTVCGADAAFSGALRPTGTGGAEGEIRFDGVCDPVEPGPPRCRLHHGHTHFADLLRRCLPKLGQPPAAENELASAKPQPGFVTHRVPDRLAPVFAQHGTTDLDCVRELLGHWNRWHPDKPVALAPGNTWHVAPCWPQGVKDCPELPGPWRPVGLCGGDLEPEPGLRFPCGLRLFRELMLTGPDGLWSREMGPDGAGKPDGPGAVLPHRVVYDGAALLVAARRDELIAPAGAGVGITWRTTVDAFDAPPAPVSGAGPEYVLWGGVVSAVEGPAVGVDLDDYEASAARISANLVTVTTGEGAHPGVHLVPFPKSRAVVALPRDPFGNPPLFLGNVRVAAAGVEAPALVLPGTLAIGGQKGVDVRHTGGVRLVWGTSRLQVKSG